MDHAVDALRPRDRVGITLGPGHPAGYLHALGARDDWEDLEIGGALLTDVYAVLTHPGVRLLSGFFGPAERFLRDAGYRVDFVPADFRRFAPILERDPPRVMATTAAPPDADGFLSLALHAGATIDELHRAGADDERVLLVEVNERLPRTIGVPPEHPHRLHVDEVDLLVTTDREPFALDDPPPTEVDRAIAQHAAAFVHTGATLQTGIGAIPGTIAALLAEGPDGDFGVHSEMFTTGLMHLQRAGKVTNASKGVFDGFSVTTFALGTRALYDWLDDNDDVRFLPVQVVNSPEVIAANHAMVSINGALAVDLFGQAMADTRFGRQFSGIGGHEDFLAGTGLELEDRSLICLPSTATVDGERVSRILAELPAGTIVTTPRHQIDVVVTEHGAAELQGLTVRERAFALAAIAHPDFRDELIDRAETMS